MRNMWISLRLWLATGRTMKGMRRLYSRLVCLDLGDRLRLECCELDTHGVTLELKNSRRTVFVSERGDGSGLYVSELFIKDSLSYYKQLFGKDFCYDYSWAKLLVKADKELARKNFYLKRQNELLQLGGM